MAGVKSRSATCLLALIVVTAATMRAQERSLDGPIIIEAPPCLFSLAAREDDETRELLDVMNDTARQALQRGAVERAEIIFRGILESDAGHEGANEGLAALLLARDEVDEALQVLREGIAHLPDSTTIARMLARAYQQMGDEMSARYWRARAHSREPLWTEPEYESALADLRCELPMSALDTLSCLTTSSPEAAWVRDLAIGVAYGQLGLQTEASDYFTSVSYGAAGTQFAEQATQLQRQLDEALSDREYLRGSVKVSGRYDTNPAVIPSANNFGMPLVATPSAGSRYEGNVNYDVIRDYNFDLTAGYAFLHTSNDKAHGFDLLDNAANLTATRRGLWRDRPFQAAVRLDYDHLLVGSDPFLQRMQATPSFTMTHSDFDSTSALSRYTLYDFVGAFNPDSTPFDQDADNVTVGVVHQRQLGDRKMTLYGGYYYDHTFAEGSNFDYDGHKLQVGFKRDLPWHCMQLIV